MPGCVTKQKRPIPARAWTWRKDGSGLGAREHGRSPEAADRWSAVDFDTNTYAVWHSGTSLPPFPAALQARTVVFDAPYFDLHQAPTVRGVVNWGAHDPGVAIGACPGELVDELHSRFGLYPARDVMYDVVWPSPNARGPWATPWCSPRKFGRGRLVGCFRNGVRTGTWLL